MAAVSVLPNLQPVVRRRIKVASVLAARMSPEAGSIGSSLLRGPGVVWGGVCAQAKRLMPLSLADPTLRTCARGGRSTCEHDRHVHMCKWQFFRLPPSHPGGRRLRTGKTPDAAFADPTLHTLDKGRTRVAYAEAHKILKVGHDAGKRDWDDSADPPSLCSHPPPWEDSPHVAARV